MLVFSDRVCKTLEELKHVQLRQFASLMGGGLGQSGKVW